MKRRLKIRKKSKIVNKRELERRKLRILKKGAEKKGKKELK